MPHAIHADFRAKGFLMCKELSDVGTSHLVPLVAADRGHRIGSRFPRHGPLRTCSSGGPEKFSNHHYPEPVQYRYGYAEGVGEILKATGGTHIHIGGLPERMLRDIRQTLAALHLPADRFVHIPFVRSVWQALLDNAVDVYIGSFPYGGSRTTVEAMGAALPLVIHSNYRSEFLSVEFEVYEGAKIWRGFDELAGQLAEFDSEQLLQHSLLSRAYYETHHTTAKLRQALARIAANLPSEAQPARYRYQSDPFQSFLDDGPALHDFIAERRAAKALAQKQPARKVQTRAPTD
jgi:hypothetical protein